MKSQPLDPFGLLRLTNPNVEIKPLFKTEKAHAAWTKRFRDKMRPILEQHAAARKTPPSDITFALSPYP